MIDYRSFCAIAVAVTLVACKADAPGKSMLQRPFADASAVASSAEMPPGWTPVDPPSDEQRENAGRSRTEWRVFVESRLLTIAPAKDRRPAAPTLPFPLPKGAQEMPMPEPSSVLQTNDGFLVGFDGGEWGGGLRWFAPDGTKHVEIAKENVRGLVRVAEDEALSLEGLHHMDELVGTARWVTREGGAWATVATADLGADPTTFVVTPEAVLVVTSKGLARIRSDHTAEMVQPLDLKWLYPNSIVADTNGRLFIGMRHFVLRLTPAGSAYTPQWFVLSK